MYNNLYKYITISITALLLAVNAHAQTVEYTYKPLAAEGCSVKYCVTKQNNAYYILVTVHSDRLMFLKESTFLLKTIDGETIKLNGNLVDNGSTSAGIVSGNMIIPINSINSTAQFHITPEQFELLKKGISKVRLSTIPINHERSFKKDKIGKKLYQFFLKEQSKNNVF